ncbi:MAG: rRNA pseudouridine synthase [Nanoarchaeota archaeon]|nr:rRNA pseudouridine synthase [Nanoarchaeota archaeon]
MEERVQKIIAAAGICSKRKAEEMISQGIVSVNGNIIKLGDKADANKDMITVSGKKIVVQDKEYLAVYKPKNVLTSKSNDLGKKTIYDVLDIKENLFYAGRLDYDAEGLLILTNDGNFANLITHPRYEIKKTYRVFTDREVEKSDIEKLKKGIDLEDGKTRPAFVKLINPKLIELTIHEGKKHIVKRMFGKLGYEVLRLIRTGMGPVTLKGMRSGDIRKITKEELDYFK